MRGDSYDFAEIVKTARARCEKRFVDGAKEILLEDTDWSYEEEFGLLSEEVKSVADQCRKDETKKMVNLIEVSSRSAIGFFWGRLKIWVSAKLQAKHLRTCGTSPQQGNP